MPIYAKKRYGQNFLTDANILRKIITSVDLQPDETVLEIGTGKGVLTRELDALAGKVISIEIDKDLVSENERNLAPQLHRTQLVFADFLEMEIPSPSQGKQYKVVANIPYYITTPIIEKLLHNRDRVSSIYIMMQREVADRLVARPGTREYSSFSIYVGYYCSVQKLFNVSRNCFRPAPKVDSAFVRLQVRERPLVDVTDEKTFFEIVHAAFWGRRKTILSAIRKYPATRDYANLCQEALDELGFPHTIRGERLSVADFAAIANYVERNRR